MEFEDIPNTEPVECNCMVRYEGGEWMPAIKDGDVFRDPRGLKIIEPKEWRGKPSLKHPVRQRPLKGEVWKHYKGELYKIIAIGKEEPLLTEVVIYHSCRDYDAVWVRHMEDFMGFASHEGVDRFQKVG